MVQVAVIRSPCVRVGEELEVLTTSVKAESGEDLPEQEVTDFVVLL